MRHKHGVTSNTHQVFQTFRGCRVKGFLHDVFPLGRCDLSAGSRTLVFECGWGLTIGENGSHWTESPEDVQRAIGLVREQLQQAIGDTSDILKLAGERTER